MFEQRLHPDPVAIQSNPPHTGFRKGTTINLSPLYHQKVQLIQTQSETRGVDWIKAQMDSTTTKKRKREEKPTAPTLDDIHGENEAALDESPPTKIMMMTHLDQDESSERNSGVANVASSPTTTTMTVSHEHGDDENDNNNSKEFYYEKRMAELEKTIQAQNDTIQSLRKQLFRFTNNLSDLQLDDKHFTVQNAVDRLFVNVHQYSMYAMPNLHAQQMISMAQKNIERFLIERVDPFIVVAQHRVQDDDKEPYLSSYRKSVQLFAEMSWIIAKWLVDLSKTKIGDMFRVTQRQLTINRSYLGYYGEFDSEEEEYDRTTSMRESSNPRAGNILLNMLTQRWKQISADIISNEGRRLENFAVASYLKNMCKYEKELKSAGYSEFSSLVEYYLDRQKQLNVDQYLQVCFESERFERYCSKVIDLGRFEECLNRIYRDLVPKLSGLQYETRVTFTTKLYNYIQTCLNHQLQFERNTSNGVESSGGYDRMIQKSIDHWLSSVHEHYDHFSQCMPIYTHLVKEHHVASKHGLKVIFPMMQLILTQFGKLNLRTRRLFLEMVEQFVKRIHDDFSSPTERLQFVASEIGNREFAEFLLACLWIPIHEAHGDKDSPFGQNGFNFDWQGYQDVAERELRQSILSLIQEFLPQLYDFLTRVVNVLQSASSFTVSGSFENDAQQMVEHLEALRSVYSSVGRSSDWLTLLGRVIATQKKRVTASRALVEYRDGLLRRWDPTQGGCVDWFSALPDL